MGECDHIIILLAWVGLEPAKVRLSDVQDTSPFLYKSKYLESRACTAFADNGKKLYHALELVFHQEDEVH
jgi:hypothetical protein